MRRGNMGEGGGDPECDWIVCAVDAVAVDVDTEESKLQRRRTCVNSEEERRRHNLF